jgi:hypothetical protein
VEGGGEKEEEGMRGRKRERGRERKGRGEARGGRSIAY